MKIKFLIAGKGIMVWLICLLASATGKTAQAQTFTLQQVLNSIDTHNPGLQQFALQTQASYAMGDAAKAWMAPTAGAGLSEFPYPGNDKMNNGPIPRKMLMLRLQQMFPNFSKQKQEEAYYRSYTNQNRDNRATMKNMLFAKAKMAYADAYIAEKKLAVIAEQEKQLQLLIQIAEGRLAYNQATLPNIYKARARLSDLQSTRIKISSLISQSASIMNSLMDRPVDMPLQIDTSENLAQYPAYGKAITGKQMNILQADSAYMLTHRTDILHTADEIYSMELKKKISSAEAKPTFGITWDNMRMNSGMYMYNVMAMVSIPIAPWSSRGYKSKVRSMDYQIQAMQKMRDNQVQQALGAIRKDWLNLQSAQKEIKVFQTQVIPAYAKTFQANLNAFSEHTGDIYETLMAWNDLTMKKMEYYDKLSDLLNIRIMLETEMQKTR